MNKHWTEADFLNRLYGAVDEDTHLTECVECKAKWERWSARRRKLVSESEVPALFLKEQRLRIQERINRRVGWPSYVKWSPALAIAILAVIVVSWRTPAPQPDSQGANDRQLMSEIYRTVSSPEPGAIEPLRGLFEQGNRQ